MVQISLGRFTSRYINVRKLENACLCYFVKNPVNNLYPSKIYLDQLIKASKSRDFPKEYIDFLNKQEYRRGFKIDHGFSLLFYGGRRIFKKET
jgi:hypothetical protein